MRRLALLAALLAAGAVVPGAARGRPADHMKMVGNMRPYPRLAAVPPPDLRRARRLLRASRAAAHRFDTATEARRLGYQPGPDPPRRPGFTHFRKHGWHFWGRVFVPRSPQSLVFWCPRRGHCTLAAFMYRAPAGMPPGTWGGLLQWHRHGAQAGDSWMTHVWLVPRLREAFATCAPMAALARWLGIRPQAYRHHSGHLEPCRQATM